MFFQLERFDATEGCNDVQAHERAGFIVALPRGGGVLQGQASILDWQTCEFAMFVGLVDRVIEESWEKVI